MLMGRFLAWMFRRRLLCFGFCGIRWSLLGLSLGVGRLFAGLVLCILMGWRSDLVLRGFLPLGRARFLLLRGFLGMGRILCRGLGWRRRFRSVDIVRLG